MAGSVPDMLGMVVKAATQATRSKTHHKQNHAFVGSVNLSEHSLKKHCTLTVFCSHCARYCVDGLKSVADSCGWKMKKKARVEGGRLLRAE